MAWTYGFFNSVNGDRLYNADQMSKIFEGLITDGVYEAVGNKLVVQPNSGMTVQIGTGRGWVGGHWVNNDSEYLQPIEASDVVLNRYCAVCIRVDENDSVRSAVPYFKYSEFASTPVKPTVERTETVKELCLAYIYIKAGATEITASDIEDTRGNSELCGWVTGLIEQLSTTTLFEQWTDIFNNWYNATDEKAEGVISENQVLFDNWFNSLQDLINENTETMLVAALPVSVTAELTADNWTDNTQSVTVTGMNTTKSVVVSPNSETSEIYGTAGIKCTSQGTNTLTFMCESVPSENVKVDVLHMGV